MQSSRRPRPTRFLIGFLLVPAFLSLSVPSLALDLDDPEALATELEAIESLKDSDPSAGEQRARALLSSAESTGDELLLARVKRVLALNLNVLGNNDDALVLLDAAIEQFQQYGAIEFEAMAWRNRGVALFDSERLDEAVDSYLSALALFELLGDEPEQAKTLSNIGNVFFELDDYVQAASYHRRALPVFKRTGITIGIAGAAINLGAALRGQVDHPDYERLLVEAESSYYLALEAFRELGNMRGETMVLNNLAGLAQARGDDELAMEMVSNAFQSAEATGDHRSILTIGRRFTATLHAAGRNDEALALTERLIELARDSGSDQFLVIFLNLAGSILADMGGYEQALNLVRESVQVEQGMLRAETELRLNEIMGRYESERLQRENLELRQAEELARIRAERQRLIIIAAILVAGVSLIAIATLISRIRLRDRARVELDYAARHDPLTGALNRRGLRDALNYINNQTLSLILVDIDHFKKINDQHGHDVGDAALIAVVEHIRTQLEPGDLLVRWGGEEFLVLRNRSEDLDQYAQRLIDATAQAPIEVSGDSLSVTISAGTAVKPAGASFSDAIRLADHALMAAKQDGRNRFRSATAMAGR